MGRKRAPGSALRCRDLGSHLGSVEGLLRVVQAEGRYLHRDGVGSRLQRAVQANLGNGLARRHQLGLVEHLAGVLELHGELHVAGVALGVDEGHLHGVGARLHGPGRVRGHAYAAPLGAVGVVIARDGVVDRRRIHHRTRRGPQEEERRSGGEDEREEDEDDGEDTPAAPASPRGLKGFLQQGGSAFPARWTGRPRGAGGAGASPRRRAGAAGDSRARRVSGGGPGARRA